MCFPFLLQASETQKFTPHTGTPHIFYTCNRENVLALVEIELIQPMPALPVLCAGNTSALGPVPQHQGCLSNIPHLQ